MLSFLIMTLIHSTYTCGEIPATQLMVTDKGLQYGKHVSAGWIQERLKNMPLPDVIGRFRLHILGDVEYKLSSITVSQVDFPEPSVQFYEDVRGLKASISGLNIAVQGMWMVDLSFMHYKGSFDLAVFNVGLTSLVNVGRSFDGHLSIASVNCSAEVENTEMNIHGWASWIYQWVVGHLRADITESIRSKICPAVKNQIINLEYHLQAMKVSYQVDQNLAVDIPLTNSPSVDASSLGLKLKGKFYSIRSHTQPPFKPQPFVLPKDPQHMLALGLSEFTVNSASFGYFSDGLLQTRINDSMIPPSSPYRLNTSSFGSLIPQLPKLYPGLQMELLVFASEVPLFSFQPGAVTLDLPGVIKATAIQPNSTLTPLFTLTMNLTLTGKVWISDGVFKGTVGMSNFTLGLVSSEVGPFKTDALARVMKMGIHMFVLPKLNEVLGHGFPLPSLPWVQMVNTALTVEKGFIAITSDAELRSSKRWAS